MWLDSVTKDVRDEIGYRDVIRILSWKVQTYEYKFVYIKWIYFPSDPMQVKGGGEEMEEKG